MRSTCRPRTRTPRRRARHGRSRPRPASARASSSCCMPRVVEEDLRRPEAEQEPPRPGRLLDDPRVHRDLHRMARERRDDPPADRQPLGLAGHQRRDDRRGARLHPVLAPPRIRLGEPDRVHPGLVHHASRLEHLVERLHRQLHHADPERHGHGLGAVFGRVRRPLGVGLVRSGESGLIPSSAPSGCASCGSDSSAASAATLRCPQSPRPPQPASRARRARSRPAG